MARRTLFWKLYGLYLLITLAAAFAVGAYAVDRLRTGTYATTVNDLGHMARVAALQVPTNEDTIAARILVANLAKASGVYATLFDRSGHVRASTDPNLVTGADLNDRPEVAEALALGSGTSLRGSRTLHMPLVYAAAFGPDTASLAVRLARPVSELETELATARQHLLVVGVLTVLGLALVGLFAFRRITKPLEDLRRGAERFGRGELDYRLSATGNDELTAVATAMNEMARILEERMRTLARERAEQETVLSSLLEGVILLDDNSCVLSMNRTAATLCAVDPETSLGRPLEAILRFPAVQEMVARLAMEPERQEVELEIFDRTLRIQGTRLKDGGGVVLGTLLVLNDITRIQRLERVRRDFVANVSHELKTPITAVKGYIETLRDGAVDDSETAHQFLDIALKQADRLNAIIEDLLSLSRLESDTGRDEIILDEDILRPVLVDALETCATRAAGGHVRVELDCPADLKARINYHLLQQAVVNLLDNGIKYSGPGDAVVLSAQRAQDRILIHVKDTGCGIAAEHLPRLFERFYRVDKARSRKLGGTGLGLSIVKHIALAHGGSVSVESTVGQGSTFTISLDA